MGTIEVGLVHSSMICAQPNSPCFISGFIGQRGLLQVWGTNWKNWKPLKLRQILSLEPKKQTL